MEHLKYLEEYSIRTEDDDDDDRQITPRRDVTAGDEDQKSSSRDQNHSSHFNDSGYVLDEWDPTKVDHSTSFEASNASTVVSAYKNSSSRGNVEHNNNVYSGSDNHGYDNNVDPDQGTNLDDVRL